MRLIFNSSFSPFIKSTLSLLTIFCIQEDNIGGCKLAGKMLVNFRVQIRLGSIYLIDGGIAENFIPFGGKGTTSRILFFLANSATGFTWSG